MATPEHQVLSLDNCRSLLLASDGLWDVFETKDVPSHLGDRSSASPADLASACDNIVGRALSSRDNTTVIAVRLQKRGGGGAGEGNQENKSPQDSNC